MKKSHKKTIWLMMVFLLIFGKNAFAAEIPRDIAVHCILGEARLEYSRYGYDSLLAIAEGIRNRGHLSGVYGCNADFEDEVSYMKIKGHYMAAEKAWSESEYSNLIKGASFWGSTIVDQEWIQKMKDNGFKLTYKLGNHKFYKEIK